VVYTAPLQNGPSNLLWPEPTGYHATMVGFPYDDLDGWRGPYPPEVFVRQMEKVADGFDQAIADLRQTCGLTEAGTPAPSLKALAAELTVAAAAAIHWRSVAQQSRFVIARRALALAKSAEEARPLLQQLEQLLKAERELARRLYALQIRDSRLGFEATNHYYYVPADLMEKVLNCEQLLKEWLPQQQRRW
jgi:hypothetical protein